jgi:copper resistance protein B
MTAYWNTQLGLRHDSGIGPARNWLAFGVEGLAPYWFDLEATAYVGAENRTALRLAASHDILLTQKLILKPQIEVNFYGKNDAERNIGSGLSEITSGLRLRYEIRRQLAPYIGLEWNNKFGNSADYARLAGEKSNENRLVAGVQFWF